MTRKNSKADDTTTAKRRVSEQGVVRNKSKKAKKKERQAALDWDEERRLTLQLFGKTGGDDDDDETAGITEQVTAAQTLGEKGPVASKFTTLFEIDRVGGSGLHDDNDDAAADDDDDDDPRTDDNALVVVDKTTNNKPALQQADGDAPAWQDDDDDDDDDDNGGITVNLLDTSRLRKLRTSKTEEATSTSGAELEHRLRQRFRSTAQIGARTDWAKLKEEDDSDHERLDNQKKGDDDDELEDSAEPLLLSSGTSTTSRLPPTILNTMRCPDANLSDPNKAVVQAVHFHPGSDPDHPLLLTAGFDKTLRFFQVGAEKSVKIHGIHFPNLPIYSASFLGTTGNVVISGRRPFFYLYDAVAGKLDLVPRIVGRDEKSLERCVASPDGRTLAFCGNDGYIILYDAHAKHVIGHLKMNGSVRAISFSANGEQVLASGSDGDVYKWDLHSRRCLERFSNEDGTITSTMAVSCNHHLAVGAESGVVNLYAERNFNNNKPHNLQQHHTTRIKSIMNLHTSADLVRFNQDGQILALSSRREKMALKLVHVPTATVFSNWPTSKTPLNYCWSMDFSPASRFMAIGNDQGKCLLYRLNHYQD